MDYKIRFADFIYIYSGKSLLVKTSIKGIFSKTYTFFNAEKQLLIIRRKDFLINKSVEILYKDISLESLEIEKISSRNHVFLFNNKILKYTTLHFKRKYIKFYINDKEVGYGEDAKFIQSAGNYSYNCRMENISEIENMLLFVLFIGSHYHRWH